MIRQKRHLPVIKRIREVYNLHEPAVRWMMAVQMVLLGGGSILLLWVKGGAWFFPYAVGGLLSTFNFMVLARILPALILSGDTKASVVSLLVSFYSRLLLTGIILVIGIVFLKFEIAPLVLGLSTIVATMVSWIIKYIITDNNKEAFSHVRNSSSRITS